MVVSFKEDESEGNQRRNQINKQKTFMVISKKIKVKQGHGPESEGVEAATLQGTMGGGLSKEA